MHSPQTASRHTKGDRANSHRVDREKRDVWKVGCGECIEAQGLRPATVRCDACGSAPPIPQKERSPAMPAIAFLECSRCHARLSADTPQTVCTQCADPPAGALYVRYDLSLLHGSSPRLLVGERAPGPWDGMWRYRAVLPDVEPVTLGEGWMPMLRSRRHPNLFVKDEGTNPTGSFKARGLALAVTMARHYGLRKLAIPSAGNAAGALAAYAAAAGIEAHIFMPRDVPLANYVEAMAYGAHVTLVDGLISDCARRVGELKTAEGWFDISTLKEPFRVEGKKTMGYELVEQLGWEYPDAVFYPTGGGVGLIGMWKAFAELEELGWVRPGRRPRMFAIQASGCAPVVEAFESGAAASAMWPDAHTAAAGLRVPKPYGDYLILDILRASGGRAVAVSDEAIFASLRDWAANEGMFLSPEGAAATAAYEQLLATGVLDASDRVVLFNTGAGLKYTDVISEALGLRPPG
jgi:threonine synthase